MLNNISKLTSILLTGSLLILGLSCAQEENSDEQNHTDLKNHNTNHVTLMDSSKMNNDNQNMDHDNMMDTDKKEMMEDDEFVIHEGKIDLIAIDKNKDGKVYQDMMDWNVISDEPGNCPLCGMTLKEVTIDKAKENLQKHDYQVK